MSALSRRDLVRSLGIGALAFSSARAWAGTARRRRRPPPLRAAELEPIVEGLLRTPRAEVLDFAAAKLGAGLPWNELEAAVFLAAIRGVSSRPPGQLSHAFLVSESVFQLAEAGPPEERLLPVLFNLDDMKESQAGQRERRDWPLPPAPQGAYADAGAAQAELAAALAAWDGPRADRAVTGLLRLAGMDATFEALWPFVARDLGGLGHKAIFGAHAERTLRRIGAEHAEPVLRSLVYCLTQESRPEEVEDFAASREAARGFPAAWRAGEARPEASLALARVFLAGEPAEARAAAVAAVAEGLGAATVWDAVRLSACDLFARQPSLLPVHATTITNALHHVCRAARDETTCRSALLQAAAWIPRLRDALARHGGISPEHSVLDELLRAPQAPAPSLEEVFDDPTPARVRAHLEQGGSLEAFVARLRSSLYRAVDQDHQPKYAAALLEDVRAAHPRWRSVLLAPALGYLPLGRATATPVYERSRELLLRLSKG